MKKFVLVFLLLISPVLVSAQETTGALQGTVKDSTGAAIPGAKVTATTPTLVGGKSTTSDSKGFYHFSNMPPGSYLLTVEAKGFSVQKRAGLVIEVGHEPSVDLTLSVGSESTVVDVTTESPVIDVTTVTTQTTVTPDVIQDVPHGRSFQSVIQFAPSARQEPLQGNTTYSGSGGGGSSPGNASNGQAYGYSVAGGADSENSYLVEGQETADVIGGFSHTNVPFDFIEEMQLKTSGVQAEYRGALGGTVNVIMKKGTNQFHGSVVLLFENGAMNGSPSAFSEYDPTSSTTTLSNGYVIDPTYQQYQPQRSKINDFAPGFAIGGPIWRDKVFFFAGFNPEFRNVERKLNYNQAGSFANLGVVPFSQNTQTYYSTARVDAAPYKKVHLFASWLYQGQRQAGSQLPGTDSTTGLFNPYVANDPANYAHKLSFSAPNITTNFGADYTITNSLVSTTRFGYFFANYHDIGYPTGGNIYQFAATGTASSGAKDVNGNALPASLQQTSGTDSQALDGSFTHRNAEKHTQFDQDLAWYKSGWAGKHDFKIGYQLNKQSDDIFQGNNAPVIQVWPGQKYVTQTTAGAAACAQIVATQGPQYSNTNGTGCSGTYGYETVYDIGTGGTATSYNHALYFQDAWTLGRGITMNYGVRIEKEFLPAENQPGGQIVKPINFGWGDKIAPRVGAAWDVYQNGKLKVFGEYGVFTDVLKLNLAISSFGGQYWNNCTYALNTANYTSLAVTADAAGRYCPSNGGPALLTGGTTPTGFTYIENANLRQFPTSCSTCSATAEGVAPGLKPYRQHESAFGVDYQLKPTIAFEARWDRRRLDNAIEDSSLYNPNDGGETFVVVNPGQGVNSTFNGFWNFLYGAPPPACSGTACPPTGTIPAARSYDGVELRMTKSASHHWFAMASYTYSHFRGNYTGLTSSDVGDGGGGRNAPNNGRSFDEPYFSWNSMGGSASGVLPTDRPNVGKGYAYYDIPWSNKFMRGMTTDIGLFQILYQGSPVTSYLDVGLAFPGAFPTFVEGRGKWVDVSQNVSTGAITTGNAYARRTPAYTQSDLNFRHSYKFKESQSVAFDATFSNLLNQRAVTAYNAQIDSDYTPSYVAPTSAACQAYNQAQPTPSNSTSCYLQDGAVAYAAFMHPYNYKALLTSQQVTVNSQYGKPYLFQGSRTIRLQLHYTF
jgi:hypothetical protein